jgi:hypothetical protein
MVVVVRDFSLHYFVYNLLNFQLHIGFQILGGISDDLRYKLKNLSFKHILEATQVFTTNVLRGNLSMCLQA